MAEQLDLDPNTLTTRAEAAAWVRRVAKPCRGPLKEGVQEQINALLAERTEAARQAAAELGQKFRGIPRKDPNKGIVYDRCGADFNEQILSQALDGKDGHTAVCPKCGVTTTYKAPWFPELPDSEMMAPTE